MMTLSKSLCARLAVAALLLPFLFSCSKETPAEEDRIAVIPSGQTAEDLISKQDGYPGSGTAVMGTVHWGRKAGAKAAANG